MSSYAPMEERVLLTAEPPAALDTFYADYAADFPAEERKSRVLLEELLRRGAYRIIGARDRESGALAAYLMGYPVCEGHHFWLDFYAVRRAGRGAGLGSWILRNLHRIVPCEGLFIEVDPVRPDDGDDSPAVRRIRFYERMGAWPLPVDYSLLLEDGSLFPMLLYYLPWTGTAPDRAAVATAITTTFEYTYGVMPEAYPIWRDTLAMILGTVETPCAPAPAQQV